MGRGKVVAPNEFIVDLDVAGDVAEVLVEELKGIGGGKVWLDACSA